jgi:thymidine kinase
MAKVYFYYAMNGGKSTVLLQSSYNYRERGMRTLLFAPSIDWLSGTAGIESRIGLRSAAIALTSDDDLLARVRTEHAAQIEIGGNDRYVPMCRKHYKEALVAGKSVHVPLLNSRPYSANP